MFVAGGANEWDVLEAATSTPADMGLTTGSYLARWLEHARGRVRACTYEGYESLLRLHAMPALGEVPLVRLHPLDLQELYGRLLRDGERPLAAGTVDDKQAIR